MKDKKLTPNIWKSSPLYTYNPNDEDDFQWVDAFIPVNSQTTVGTANTTLILNGENKMTKFMSKVSVLVIDTDARVPLEKRVLMEKEPFWSEDNNEDLFYGINLGDLLAEHNKYRETVVWEEKDCNGVTHTRTGLPAIKFSDLKKEVVNYIRIPLKNAQ